MERIIDKKIKIRADRMQAYIPKEFVEELGFEPGLPLLCSMDVVSNTVFYHPYSFIAAFPLRSYVFQVPENGSPFVFLPPNVTVDFEPGSMAWVRITIAPDDKLLSIQVLP